MYRGMNIIERIFKESLALVGKQLANGEFRMRLIHNSTAVLGSRFDVVVWLNEPTDQQRLDILTAVSTGVERSTFCKKENTELRAQLAKPRICSVPKENLKEKFYFIEQAGNWILWHGTLDDLKNSLLGNLKRLEYTLNDSNTEDI